MTRLTFVFLLVASVARAHQGHHAKADGKLTGEVVDLTCYHDHASKSDKHAACARKCIESGLPVGIVAGGKLYAVIVSSHESPNAKLAPYAGKLVTITGKVMERDGLRAVDMEDVQPATE